MTINPVDKKLTPVSLKKEPPSFLASTVASGSTLCDGISVFRNSINFAGQFTKSAPLFMMPVLFMVPGSVGVIIGSKGMLDNAYQLYQSKTALDVSKSFLGLMVASSFTLLCSLMFLIGAAATTTTGAAAGALIATVGIPAFYGALLISGTLKLIAHTQFIHEFEKEIESLKTGEDQKKMLQKLLQKEGYIDWLHFNTNGKDSLLYDTIQKLEQVDFSHPLWQDEELIADVIQEILLSAKKRRFEQMTIICIAVAGLSSLAAPALAPIIFIVSAIVWLSLDSFEINRLTGDFFYGKSHLEKYLENSENKI